MNPLGAVEEPQLGRGHRRGRAIGQGPEERCLARHGYYPKVLNAYGYIFMYRDRILWAGNQPSRYVVESIDGTSVGQLATHADDLHILCDSLHMSNIVVSEIPVGSLTRRRGRPSRPDRVALELNAAEARHEDRLLLAVNADGFRSVRQYWNIVGCEYCGAIDLLYFRKPKDSRCCNNGKAAAYSNTVNSVAMEPLEPLPPFLLSVLRENNVAGLERDLLHINNFLNFAITAVDKCRDDEDELDDNGRRREHNGYENQRGGCVTIYGRTYKRFKGARADNGLGFYLTGGVDRLVHAARTGVDPHERFEPNEPTKKERHRSFDEYIMRGIAHDIMAFNKISKELHNIGDWMESLNERRINPETVNTHIAELRNGTAIMDVSIIRRSTNDAVTLSVIPKGNEGDGRSVNQDSVYYETLSYPLFFTAGEPGWGSEHDIRMSMYVRWRILQPEPFYVTDPSTGAIVDDGVLGQWRSVLQPNGTRADVFCGTNRFQTMSLLTQYYLVDMASRNMDRRIKAMQSQTIQARLGAAGYNNDDNSPENKLLLIGKSMPGCLQQMKSLSRNMLETVSQRGAPHVFITLTTDTEWPEIQEMLLPGQTAFDRPDIVCRVFHERKEAVLHNIRKGKYFDAEVDYEVHVIEYQDRGLPHAHIVMRFKNMPQHGTPEMLQWIDKYISCTCPPQPTPSSTPQEIRLHYLKTRKMKHTCSGGANGCIDRITGKCKKRFDQTLLSPTTVIDEKDYVVYKRTKMEDLRMVSTTDSLLLDFDGHANVAFASNIHCIFYLFDYLFKGQKKVYQRLINVEDDNSEEANVRPDKQFRDYLKCRKLCSMDACWRNFGYQTYPAPTPPVLVVETKNEKHYLFFCKEKLQTDVMVYFERPQQMEEMLLQDFFKDYIYTTKNPTPRARASGQVHDVTLESNGNTVYIVERKHIQKPVVRIHKTSQQVGEEFYIRLLFKYKSARCFSDLRTVNGVVYETFVHAAIAEGLVSDYDTLVNILDEMCLESNGRRLRSAFATLTLHGYPTRRIIDIDEYLRKLCHDYIDAGDSLPTAKNNFLSDLSRRLDREGRKLKDYEFPEPNDDSTLLQRELLRHDQAEQHQEYMNLLQAFPNTTEQQEFIDAVQAAIFGQSENDDAKIFCLQGSGGTGKSNTLAKIMCWARSIGKLTLGCAATAIAASQFPGFETAHGLFNLPVPNEVEKELEDEYVYESRLSGEKLELLLSADVILWDECFSSGKQHIDASSEACNKFKGKVIIFTGDIKQILTIADDAAHETLLASLITRSKLWPLCTKHVFTQNMRMLRAADYDPQEALLYGQYITGAECIGLGKADNVNVFESDIPCDERDTVTMIMPNAAKVFDAAEVLQFMFPNGYDFEAAKNQLIVAVTNAQVNKWNETIQQLNPNPIRVYISRDEVSDVDDVDDNLRNILTEAVKTKADKPTSPPHVFKIKVGDVAFLTHNIDRSIGAVHNARVVILELRDNFIKVQTVATVPHTLLIPRIRTKITLNKSLEISLLRTQFPLKLAFASTINKAQSQSLDKVVVDLTHPLFAHGMLYVALTRVRNPRNILFYTREDLVADFPENDLHHAVQVRNIVHKDILKQVLDNID